MINFRTLIRNYIVSHIVVASLKSKVQRNKMTTAGQPIEYRCLIRATDGKKTISTSVSIDSSFSLSLSLFLLIVFISRVSNFLESEAFVTLSPELARLEQKITWNFKLPIQPFLKLTWLLLKRERGRTRRRHQRQRRIWRKNPGKDEVKCRGKKRRGRILEFQDLKDTILSFV